MSESIKILIAGDFCPSERVQKLIDAENYNFIPHVSTLGEIDYSIVNLECPILSQKCSPIMKYGPCLSSNIKALYALKSVGFNCVTLANNHFRDFGDIGCCNTIKELNKLEIDHVGGGKNLLDATKILYKEICGVRFAFVNFCENEFSIATSTHAGAAPLDVVANYHQIVEARRHADKVIVIVHGGHEMYQLPSPRMKQLYHFFIEIGADAVINHHQHCYSGFEYFNGKPIVYGLGNFCFDDKGERNSIWNQGYMALLTISSDQIILNPIPYTQCNDEPSLSLLRNKQDFENSIISLNQIIGDDIKLLDNFNLWISKFTRSKRLVFSSYHNRYLNAAAVRRLLPCLLTRNETPRILNNIECESHRDITLAVLKNFISKS